MKKPITPPVAAPEAPAVSPKVKTKPGPKAPAWQDLTGLLAEIKEMSPSERQAARTARGEALVDAWMIRATERLMSNSVRSQDLVAVAGFLRANQFVVAPSKEGVEDPLDKLIRKRKADEADEARRLKNMARAKQAEEERVEKFYAKQNGQPLTPRLNTGDPGPIMEREIDSDEQ